MKLKDLIPFLEENKREIKIHCAKGRKNNYEPQKKFFNGQFKEWQEHQNKNNFTKKYILSLIYWGQDEWLFAGVYEKISVRRNGKNEFFYETKISDIAAELVGRLIVGYKRGFRNSYPHLATCIDNIEILEIKREIEKNLFPGYDKVNVSWQVLSGLINTDSWKTALENQKGVYLITNSDNGKMYIGSACGKDMLLGRWKNYIKNGHGGNVELKSLKFEYIKKYFRYSILETFKSTTDDGIILERESWWKDVLQSRKFGYNKN